MEGLRAWLSGVVSLPLPAANCSSLRFIKGVPRLDLLEGEAGRAGPAVVDAAPLASGCACGGVWTYSRSAAT
jgi:hypothetical protein